MANIVNAVRNFAQNARTKLAGNKSAGNVSNLPSTKVQKGSRMVTTHPRNRVGGGIG